MPRTLERYYKILRRPRVTEKSLKMVERHRAYPFEVNPDANKIDEAIHSVLKRLPR